MNQSLTDNGATRFLRSTWGALTIIVTAAVVGGGVTLWFAGLTDVPDRVDHLEGRQVAQDSLIAAAERRLEWVVCTTVPPNRADVLAALQVSCPYGERSGQFSQPVPPPARVPEGE